MSYFSRALRAALAAASLLFSGAVASAQANHIVISQVYGGGGGGSTTTTYTYNTDYVELYNPTSQAVSLQGLSLQYGSASGSFGTSSSNIKALTGTIQPNSYYLVTGASGTAGGTLPVTADETGSFSLSATAGKVALVTGTTGSFTSCTASTVVDEVSYGGASAVSCAEGTAVAALSNTTAAIRTPSGTDSNNNSADFTVGTPNPHNSTSGGTTPTTALAISSASASPASVMQGNSTTLSVLVTPGSSSTSIAVTANLSSIGGSTAQALTLSSTANTYTATLAVPAGAAAGSYTFPVTATDAQNETATGSISLTVTAATVSTPIATIQANRSTYVGTTIQTQGVVTVVTSSGYYLQTPSSTPGSTGDEGIYVYAGSGKVPSTIAVGNLVTINGTLTLYPSASASHAPSLEVTAASVTSNGTAALPAAIALPANFPTPGAGIYQLQPYESMLVKIPSLTAIGPTDGNLTETTETIVSTGEFYAEATGVARPFREPGIDFRDFPASTCPTVSNCTATTTTAGVTRPAAAVLFDDNPERLLIESSLGGGTALDVSTGAVLTNVTGVVDFSYFSDSYEDPARIILQPGTVTAANYTPGITVQPLAVPGSNQVTISAFNIERFFNPSASDNIYYNAGSGKTAGSSAVNVTADAYARRLKKLSLAIRTVLNTPDVIAFEEVENLSVLKDIATQIDTDATAAGATAPGYVAYGTDSTTTFTDDVGGISVGFLVKPSTTDVVRWEQIGAQSTFAASTGTQTLNDRPSQVLHVGFKRAGASDYAMTLIVNHLRSLSGISTSADTRLKKELQAEMLANAIQGYQAAGERVLAMGDMNAFEFSDGYTDTLGTITGKVSPTGTSVQAGSAITSPAATDLVTLLAPADRHSYVEYGNAQVLDHIVATSNVVSSTLLAYAHLNADFPEILTNDATTPARTSDHDAALAYLTVPAPVVSGTLTGSGSFATAALVGTSSAGQQFVLTNTGEAAIAITAIATTGDFAQSNSCGTSLAAGSTCQISVVFTPTGTGARTGTLTVTSNATGLSSAALSGTGYAITATIAGSAAFGSTTVGSSSAAQTFAVKNTGGAAISITAVAVTGDYTQTNTCGSSLAVGATCQVNVVFKPTAAGTRTGTLTLTSNATGLSPVVLSGTGAAAAPVAATFTFTNGGSSSYVTTVSKGTAAQTTLTLTPSSTFAGTVTYSCTGLPANTSCEFTPTSTTIAAGTTAAQSIALLVRTSTLNASNRVASGTDARLAFVFWAPGLLLAGMGARSRRLHGSSRLLLLGVLLLGFAGVAGITGCGSNSSPNFTSTTAAASGTYSYGIVATGGGVTQTVAGTLTIQ